MVDETSEATMPDETERSSSARIIPFPDHFRPPIVDTLSKVDHAIRALVQANSELRDNVSDWRDVINELSVTFCETAESSQVINAKLTAVASHLQTHDAKEPEMR